MEIYVDVEIEGNKPVTLTYQHLNTVVLKTLTWTVLTRISCSLSFDFENIYGQVTHAKV